MTSRETYDVEVGGVERRLPLFEVAPGVRIAVFNLLGDTEIVETAARELAGRLKGLSFDVLVTAETKSVPLVYALARELDRPWVVLRKAYKAYMGETVSVEAVSITTGSPQTLHLDEKDAPLVRDRDALLVDDVISTGGTVEAMASLVRRAGGRVAARAAVFTEGAEGDWPGVVTLGHLPVFRNGATAAA